MTGLWPHQSGIIDNIDVGGSQQEYLPNSAYIWLDAMRDSGRKTGHFGNGIWAWIGKLRTKMWSLTFAELKATGSCMKRANRRHL